MEGYIKIEKYLKLEADFATYKLASSQQIASLTFQLAQLKRMLFGAKSERFIPQINPEQLSLFGAQSKEEAPSPIEVPAHQRTVTNRKEKPARLVLPAHLEREETILEPEVDTSDMVKIGEERTEVLVYSSAKLIVKVTIRPKYAPKQKTDKTSIQIATLPSRFIDKCIADESLLAAILVDKYFDHLPLYRIGNRFKRLGIEIPRSTMCGWVAQSGDKLKVLYHKLVELVLQSNYLMVDETRMEVQTKKIPPKRSSNKPKKRKTHRGYLWGYLAVANNLLFFEYDQTRKATNPAKRLKDLNCIIQTDCYEVYDQIRKTYPNLTHYHCLTHARREFEKALDNDKKRAAYAMGQFQILYRIEEQARKDNWTREKLQQVRKEKARPVLENLFNWMGEESPKLPPKSPIAKAMGYMLKRKERMLHYLTDGKLQIDTYPLENQIRPIAVGRKNYLFAGSHEAAQRAAIFYSLFACCKMNEVDPAEWLLDVMQRLPNHPINQIGLLLPHLWNKQEEIPVPMK